MILEIKQKVKELFEAEFIVEANDSVLGEAKLVGKLGHMEGNWFIRYEDLTISMSYGKRNLPRGDKPFRPYDIFIDNKAVGTVYQTDVKEGGFFSTYPIHKLYLNGTYYTKYPISFGDEGSKSPIILDNVQIAEIHKSSLVCNELHEYCSFITDRRYGLVCLVFCLYAYVMTSFKPGKKPTMSVRKISFTDTNKYLLAKYNPEFMLNFRK